MHTIRILLLLITFVMSSACAGMFKGIDQKMTFKSQPDGADVYADGLLIGTTPLVFKLRKDEYSKIVLKKQGYRDEEILLNAKFDKLGLLNILNIPLGGIGFTTDALTGAMFAYKPGEFYVPLTKTSHASLSRDSLQEFTLFVTNNYHNMKSQCEIYCKGEYFDTAAFYISKIYDQDMDSAKKYANKHISTTLQPEEFLHQLDADIINSEEIITANNSNN